MRRNVGSLKLSVILILFAFCQNNITLVNDNTIQNICKNAFQWKLNLCNISCTSCSNSNINACNSCNS